MDYKNRRYLVIPSSIIDDIDFNQVMETSKETLRLSIDGTKSFIKYNIIVEENDRTESSIDIETGEELYYTIKAGIYGRPSIYSEEYKEYTHEEILEILKGQDWNESME